MNGNEPYLTLTAFIRGGNDYIKPDSIGGYMQREIHNGDKLYNILQKYRFESSTKIERVCTGNKALHKAFVTRKKLLVSLYGSNATVKYGNLTVENPNVNAKSNSKCKVDNAGFIAVYDLNMLFVEVHEGTTIHQFYNKGYVTKNNQLITPNKVIESEKYESEPKLFSYEGSQRGKKGKLTEADKKIILELLSAGKKQADIAKRFKVSTRTIRNVKNKHGK